MCVQKMPSISFKHLPFHILKMPVFFIYRAIKKGYLALDGNKAVEPYP